MLRHFVTRGYRRSARLIAYRFLKRSVRRRVRTLAFYRYQALPSAVAAATRARLLSATSINCNRSVYSRLHRTATDSSLFCSQQGLSRELISVLNTYQARRSTRVFYMKPRANIQRKPANNRMSARHFSQGLRGAYFARCVSAAESARR